MALFAPELLAARHDVAPFSCGQPALDHWLKTRALANQEKGFTVVMVVHDANRVAGYYGLAPTAVVAAVVRVRSGPGSPRTRSPACCSASSRPISAYRGRGIGTGLLKHALRAASPARD